MEVKIVTSSNKLTLFYVLLIFILIIPAISPFFKAGFFAAHDTVWHIARFYQFHLSFISGQIPPRWAPTLFDGLGYPAFVVNFQFPYYLMEFVYSFGINLVNTYKVLLGLTIVFSGIFAFMFLKEIFTRTAALVGSIFFIYSPYRFATIYARGALGEAVAIALVPLIFWALTIWAKGNKRAKYLFALSLFLVIISHPIIFLIFSPLIILYLIFLSRKKLSFVSGLFWFGVGILASSFQTIPSLFERHYLMFDEIYKNVYLGHFPNFYSIFRIPKSGIDLGTPFQIGIINWVAVVFSIIVVFLSRRKFKKEEQTMALFISFFFLGIFGMSKASLWFWKTIPFFSLILFPWRFLNILIFVAAVASAYIIYKLKDNLILACLLIILVIIPTRHFWGWVGQIPNFDDYYKNFQETTTAEGEFTPREISPEIKNHALVKIETLSGETRISNERLANNHWRFDALVLKNSTVKMAILDFPGWRVKLNNREGEIINNFKNQNGDYSGLIVVNLPEGNYKVEVIFGETKLRIFADYLTLISLILIMGLILKRYHGESR